MALAISVGFVVDDAIVVIENIVHRLEDGMPPLQAATEGAGSIVFTVVTISLSLVAAFLPLMFISGTIGRFLHELALTVTFAIAVSTVVALTVTLMLCGHYLNSPRSPRKRISLPARLMAATVSAYERSLRTALGHAWLMLLILVVTVVLTVWLFSTLNKGYFPQDDTGLLFGWTQAAPDVSFEEMRRLQAEAANIVGSDPAVAHVSSFSAACERFHPDPHDDARCHAWCLAAALGRGSRIGAAPPARHHRGRWAVRVPNSNAVHDSSHLFGVRALRFLAQQAALMSGARPPRKRACLSRTLPTWRAPRRQCPVLYVANEL
jgi:AcrB/AcrD/AcrF family